MDACPKIDGASSEISVSEIAPPPGSAIIDLIRRLNVTLKYPSAAICQSAADYLAANGATYSGSAIRVLLWDWQLILIRGLATLILQLLVGPE